MVSNGINYGKPVAALTVNPQPSLTNQDYSLLRSMTSLTVSTYLKQASTCIELWTTSRMSYPYESIAAGLVKIVTTDDDELPRYELEAHAEDFMMNFGST